MRNRIAVALLLSMTPAAAHITLTEPSAKPGAATVAHFRVGHGCSGSPTIALRVEIPPAVSDVRPQPAPGWTLQTETAGARTKSVTWSGGVLAADQPGVFAIAMTLPSTTGPLVFPATQTCEKGVEQWSELPAPDGHPLKNPAPVLTLSPTPGKAPDTIPGMTMPDMKMPGMKM